MQPGERIPLENASRIGPTLWLVFFEFGRQLSLRFRHLMDLPKARQQNQQKAAHFDLYTHPLSAWNGDQFWKF
jgi:hypothetical protein